MIDKETELKSFACGILEAGYLDVDFLINLASDIDNKKFKIKGEETFLFSIDKEGKVLENAIDNIRENQGENTKIDINSLINEVLESIVFRINELYGIELEIGKDVEIYTNCLDSHLSLINDDYGFIGDGENEINKAEQDEIKKIIEHFN